MKPYAWIPAALAWGLRLRRRRYDLAIDRLRGELLSVSRDSLWVLSSETVFAVPLADVQRLDIRVHNFNQGRMLKWNLVAGLGSAIALAAACNSVEGVDGCGGVFLAWSLTWGLVGGATGAFLAKSSHKEVHPSRDALRPFVRYPQGLPDAVGSVGGVRKPGG